MATNHKIMTVHNDITKESCDTVYFHKYIYLLSTCN